jgi:hypothetical protein
VLAADEPECPLSRLGMRTAPLVLLTRADVRADVGLTPEQTEAAARTFKHLQARAAELRGKSGREIVSARRAIDEAQERWVETELKPEQGARLKQIELQWEGAAALITRPTLADSLGLSPEQRAELSKALEEVRRHKGETEHAEAHALAQKSLAVLTPEQRARWKAMLGKAFVPQTAAAGGHAPR